MAAGNVGFLREEQGQFPLPRPSGFPPRNFLFTTVRVFHYEWGSKIQGRVAASYFWCAVQWLTRGPNRWAPRWFKFVHLKDHCHGRCAGATALTSLPIWNFFGSLETNIFTGKNRFCTNAQLKAVLPHHIVFHQFSCQKKHTAMNTHLVFFAWLFNRQFRATILHYTPWKPTAGCWDIIFLAEGRGEAGLRRPIIHMFCACVGSCKTNKVARYYGQHFNARGTLQIKSNLVASML